MKNNLKLSALIITAAGALLATQVAWAHGKNRDGWAGKFVTHATKKLELDSAQTEKLTALIKDIRQHKKKMHTDMQANVGRLFAKSRLTRQDALNIMEMREKSREKMRKLYADKMVAFHQMLRPEQRKEALKFFGKMFRGKWKHKRRHHH